MAVVQRPLRLDHIVRVWDVDRSLPLTQPLTHGAPVTHLAFVPGGRQLFTVAPNDAVRIWNVSLGAEGQLAPDLFLEMARAIGGLRLAGNNQLVPIAPSQRRLVLRRAELETRRLAPDEDNAYLRFVKSFLERHGPDLRPKNRRGPRHRRPGAPR